MTEDADHSAARRHTVSQRVRARRRSMGLTQQDVVARLARLGVGTSNRAVSALERGAGVDVGKLPELARCLECSVTYLLGLTDDPQCWTPDAEAAEREVRRAATAEKEPSRVRWAGVSRQSDSDAARAHPPILGPDVPGLRAPLRESER